MQQVWRITSIIFVSFSLSAQVGATHVLSHLKAGTNVGRLPAADDVATSTTDPCWWVGDYQPNSVVEHVGRWKFKTFKYDEIWWNMELPRKKTWDRLIVTSDSNPKPPKKSPVLPLVDNHPFTSIVDNHQQHPNFPPKSRLPCHDRNQPGSMGLPQGWCRGNPGKVIWKWWPLKQWIFVFFLFFFEESFHSSETSFYCNNGCLGVFVW